MARKNGVTWVAADDARAIVAVNAKGDIVSSTIQPIELKAGAVPVVPLPMHAWADRLYLGLGRSLVRLRMGADPVVDDLQHQILNLAGTPPHTLTRVAAGLEAARRCCGTVPGGEVRDTLRMNWRRRRWL